MQNYIMSFENVWYVLMEYGICYLNKSPLDKLH